MRLPVLATALLAAIVTATMALATTTYDRIRSVDWRSNSFTTWSGKTYVIGPNTNPMDITPNMPVVIQWHDADGRRVATAVSADRVWD